jgi:uncharacterized lipoprotein NlpE involved in copper resistance
VILRLLLVLALLGCQNEDELDSINVVKKAIYVQDARTNLCFAVWDPMMNSMAVTAVPCTPEVLRLVEDGEHRLRRE